MVFSLAQSDQELSWFWQAMASIEYQLASTSAITAGDTFVQDYLLMFQLKACVLQEIEEEERERKFGDLTKAHPEQVSR
jgi:hypothetical protein